MEQKEKVREKEGYHHSLTPSVAALQPSRVFCGRCKMWTPATVVLLHPFWGEAFSPQREVCTEGSFHALPAFGLAVALLQ